MKVWCNSSLSTTLTLCPFTKGHTTFCINKIEAGSSSLVDYWICSKSSKIQQKTLSKLCTIVFWIEPFVATLPVQIMTKYGSDLVPEELIRQPKYFGSMIKAVKLCRHHQVVSFTKNTELWWSILELSVLSGHVMTNQVDDWCRNGTQYEAKYPQCFPSCNLQRCNMAIILTQILQRRTVFRYLCLN